MAIRALDRVHFEGNWYASRFNHVFWVFHFSHGPDLIYESHLSGGVQVTPLSQLDAGVQSGRVMYYYLHDMDLTQEQCEQLWWACQELHGAGYDLRHIGGLLAWIELFGRALVNQPRWLLWALNDKFICSELTETTARRIGVDLCGDVSTPATSTPESQWVAVMGAPSALSYCPGRRTIEIISRVKLYTPRECPSVT